jgi:hypothetical protein
VLTVISSGSVVATLGFVGSYVTSNFVFSSVGSGANAGTVKITDPSGSTASSTVIAGGSMVDIATPTSSNVSFAGSNATLVLEQPSSFTGTVAGMATLDSIDLSQLAFGATSTLGYAENAAGTEGTLTVGNSAHAATIALLGNYMAASFVTAADGHGGTMVTETSPPTEPPHLTQPHTT